MLSPLSSDTGHHYQLTSKESFSYSESASGKKGGAQYHYEYQSQTTISSYKVSLGEQDPAASQLTYANESLSSQSLNASSGASAVGDDNAILPGASNILQFVEQRLAAEQANGASTAELEEVLQAGLDGFHQGYFEAKDILAAQGQLTDEVMQSVTQLGIQVAEGFEQLREQYINGGGASDTGEAVDGDSAALPAAGEVIADAAPDTDSESPVVLPPVTAPATSNNGNSSGIRQLLSSGQSVELASEQFTVLGNNSRSALSSLIEAVSEVPETVEAQVEYGRKDRFSFELTTLDGDKVSINAVNTTVFYGNYTAGELNAEEGTLNEQLIAGLKENNQFVFDVQGELDEQEIAAIEDLFNQIMSLADEFYNGDVNKAYESAMAIGYDQNEIAGYAVSLRQTEQYSVAAAYQEFAPALPEVTEPEEKDAIQAIGDYARDVIDTLTKPENYQAFDYSQLLTDVSKQIDQQVKPGTGPKFSDIVNGLVDQLNGIEPTSDDSQGETVEESS